MSEDEVAAQVDELAKSKLQKPKKLATLANRWVPEIILGRCEWRRHKAEVEELRTLSHSDVVDFVAATIMDPTTARKLCIHVKGAAEKARDSSKSSQVQVQVQQGENDNGACENENGTCEKVDAAKGAPAVATGPDKQGEGAADGACDAAVGDAAGIRVEADQLPQFRLSQALWPVPRHVW